MRAHIVAVISLLSFAAGLWLGRAWANRSFMHLIEKTFTKKP